MSYRPKYFQLHEVVPPDVIQARGEQAWQLMDERILRGADWLRELFGACVVNGRFLGGSFTESGLRNPMTGIGAPWSQHKFGRALDLKFHKVQVRDACKKAHTPEVVEAYELSQVVQVDEAESAPSDEAE